MFLSICRSTTSMCLENMSVQGDTGNSLSCMLRYMIHNFFLVYKLVDLFFGLLQTTNKRIV